MVLQECHMQHIMYPSFVGSFNFFFFFFPEGTKERKMPYDHIGLRLYAYCWKNYSNIKKFKDTQKPRESCIGREYYVLAFLKNH